MYSSLSGALGSMLSTFDCCPARFMRVCALRTCTDIPPCGGGYGPTKSTFINESPTPQLKGDEGPELQIHRPPAIVHLDQPLDVLLSEKPAVEALSRQQQIPDVTAQLSAEPAP